MAFASTYCLVAACKFVTGSAANVSGPVMVPPEIGNPSTSPPLPDLPSKVLKVEVEGTVNTALAPIANVPTAPVLVFAVTTLSTVRVLGVSTN